jgi:hypothetical protein
MQFIGTLLRSFEAAIQRTRRSETAIACMSCQAHAWWCYCTSLYNAQIIAGVSAPLLEHPSLSHPHLKDPWLDSHRSFLTEYDAKPIISPAWTPTLHRTNDRLIMEVAERSKPLQSTYVTSISVDSTSKSSDYPTCTTAQEPNSYPKPSHTRTTATTLNQT